MRAASPKRTVDEMLAADAQRVSAAKARNEQLIAKVRARRKHSVAVGGEDNAVTFSGSWEYVPAVADDPATSGPETDGKCSGR